MTVVLGAPQATLTPIAYGNALLSITDQSQASSIKAYLDPTEFGTGPNDGALIYHDYTNNQLVFFHPRYLGSGVTGIVSTATLGQAAASSLAMRLAQNAPAGHPYQNVSVAMGAINNGLILIIIGVALAAAAIAITFATGGTAAPAMILLFKVGVAIAIIGAVTDLVTSIFSPQLVPGSLQSNGGTTCYTIASAIGGQQTCIYPNGTTAITPTAGLGSFLTDVAWGVAAVAVVGIGSYVIWKYVSRRPQQSPRSGLPPSARLPPAAGPSPVARSPPVASRTPSIGQQAGLTVRRGASAAYHGARGLVSDFSRGLRGSPPL